MRNLIIGALALALAVGIGAGVYAHNHTPTRYQPIEVRVWESTSNPTSNYISARPEGGSWRTLGTIPLGERPASTYEWTSNGRFRYSDIRLLVPLPDAPEAVTPAGVSREVHDAVREQRDRAQAEVTRLHAENQRLHAENQRLRGAQATQPSACETAKAVLEARWESGGAYANLILYRDLTVPNACGCDAALANIIRLTGVRPDVVTHTQWPLRGICQR